MDYKYFPIKIRYSHGNKYTRAWIAHATYFNDNKYAGGFSLSYLYNGGRFSSEKSIFDCIEDLKKNGHTVLSIEKVNPNDSLYLK